MKEPWPRNQFKRQDFKDLPFNVHSLVPVTDKSLLQVQMNICKVVQILGLHTASSCDIFAVYTLKCWKRQTRYLSVQVEYINYNISNQTILMMQ
ncbi:hypothetical protein QTP88_022833 [Uroleucon formosanum]